LRGGDVRLSGADPVFRLKDAGVLQFLLAAIVDQRIFAASHRGFGLPHLRPEIVRAQLDEQISCLDRLITEDATVATSPATFVLKGVRSARTYASSVFWDRARPGIPVARDQNHNFGRHEQNHPPISGSVQSRKQLRRFRQKVPGFMHELVQKMSPSSRRCISGRDSRERERVSGRNTWLTDLPTASGWVRPVEGALLVFSSGYFRRML
jgi:hypothetical protein